MNKELMFSSETCEWATPQDFFDRLNAEFKFTLDPCASAENHKCDKYYTKEEIRFIPGRLKFGNQKNSAPFPSMVVVFRKRQESEEEDNG